MVLTGSLRMCMRMAARFSFSSPLCEAIRQSFAGKTKEVHEQTISGCHRERISRVFKEVQDVA